MPEPDLAAGRGQCFAQPLHQLMLRIDVVWPPAGQGGVLQQHRLVRRTELAAMIFGSEPHDTARDALVSQPPHSAVLDQTRLGAAGQLRERLPLEHHERNGLALQQVGYHQPSWARPHDRDARPVHDHAVRAAAMTALGMLAARQSERLLDHGWDPLGAVRGVAHASPGHMPVRAHDHTAGGLHFPQ